MEPPLERLRCFSGGYEGRSLMTIRKARSAIGLMVLGSVVLLGTPALAVEPDVDSFAGPEPPALRTDQGAILDSENMEADPSVAPDVVINEPGTPIEHQ